MMPSIEGYRISLNPRNQKKEEEDWVVLFPYNNFQLKLS